MNALASINYGLPSLPCNGCCAHLLVAHAASSLKFKQGMLLVWLQPWSVGTHAYWHMALHSSAHLCGGCGSAPLAGKEEGVLAEALASERLRCQHASNHHRRNALNVIAENWKVATVPACCREDPGASFMTLSRLSVSAAYSLRLSGGMCLSSVRTVPTVKGRTLG